MSHEDKERLSYSSYWRLEDNYHGYGDGRGGVGTRNTQLSSKKVTFDRDRHDGGFISYHSHQTGSPMALSLIKDDPVCVLGGS